MDFIRNSLNFYIKYKTKMFIIHNRFWLDFFRRENQKSGKTATFKMNNRWYSIT